MKLASRRFLGMIAVFLVIPGSFGMAANKNKEADAQPAQAQLVDHGEYPCANCFFGNSDYYFCFRTDQNKVLIGHEKVPTMNWRDTSKNYLVKAHKGWMPWQADGASVKLKFDDKYIWLPRPNGKDVRLTQDYTTDIFIENGDCRAAVHKPAAN
jgi:hypothetical protein